MKLSSMSYTLLYVLVEKLLLFITITKNNNKEIMISANRIIFKVVLPFIHPHARRLMYIYIICTY